MHNVKIGVLTGTRADFGKLKPVLKLLQSEPDIDLSILITGMHLQEENGYTLVEVQKAFGDECHIIEGQRFAETQLKGLSRLLGNFEIEQILAELDFLIVHGDRMDALGASIAAKLQNIDLIHVEGGELSGSIDERIRHSITKFADWHLVSNKEAARRVMQLGEPEHSIFITGSAEATVILSDNRPSLSDVCEHYEITFEKYTLLAVHPVVDNIEENHKLANLMRHIVGQMERNFVVIGCNNDDGFQPIREAGLSMQDRENVRYFPNLRFENYLTLLENAELAIGNSSSFVREAPIFGIPSIIPGSRQQDRTSAPSVFYAGLDYIEVSNLIRGLPSTSQPTQFFGDKNAASNIFSVLKKIFEMPRSQPKRFQNVDR